MTFQCWVFRRWVLRRWVIRGWVLGRWVFEAYCREYPTRNLELGIPNVGGSRRWVFQMLGIPYENRSPDTPKFFFKLSGLEKVVFWATPISSVGKFLTLLGNGVKT